MTYGLKEYKQLLENQLRLTVQDAPINFSNEEKYAWCVGVHSTALYAVEMLPQISNTEKPAPYTGTGNDYLDCVLGMGGFESYGPIKGVKGLTDEQ